MALWRKITIIFSTAAMLAFLEASSTRKVQYQQLHQQIIQDYHSVLFHGMTLDTAACAYICIKEETCLTFAYHQETQECTLSSKYPTLVAGEGVRDGVILPLVFMKAEERLFERPGFYFEQHNWAMSSLNALLRLCNAVSVEGCAWKCIRHYSCFGFTYLPRTAQCDLLLNSPVEVEEGHTGISGALQYLIYREWQTIAKDAYADCQEAHDCGIREPGVFRLAPNGHTWFYAWCDFDNCHGWTVIQRRLDGSVDFYRYWADYKKGFGDVNGEYWLGNDKIHALTQTNRRLSIYLMRQDGEEGTANYSTFYINDEGDDYRLGISGFSGNVDDSLTDGMGHNLNGITFSTRDRGNTNCAIGRTGAWWYWSCTWANLNGVYTSSGGSWGNVKWYGRWAEMTSMLRTAMRVTRD